MRKILRVAVSQLNTTTGALKENTKNLEQGIALGHEIGADVLVFPELCLNGLNCQGLSGNATFLKETQKAIDDIIQFTKGKQPLIIFGFLDQEDNRFYNSAGIIQNGKWLGTYRKMTADEEENVYEGSDFVLGDEGLLLNIEGIKAGIMIGNDLWKRYDLLHNYTRQGACIVFHLSAFSFLAGRLPEKESLLFCRSRDFNIGIVHANAVGGQDQWVFPGVSLVFDGHSHLKARGKSFDEDFVVADVVLFSQKRQIDKVQNTYINCANEPDIKQIDCDFSASFKPEINPKVYDYPDEEIGTLFNALQLSLKDYVNKNRFEKTVIGLSGGIDSSVVASIAVAALGRERVIGVLMPSEYTSEASVEDALYLAKKLGIKTYTLSITEVLKSYQYVLRNEFELSPGDICEQNLQARIRGNYLMDLSNRFGWLVITTGNKSETACGYCTLFGDTAGGFALIKDVYKYQVYSLGKYANRILGIDAINENVFLKAPTAELYLGQKDQDSLPTYDIVDGTLRLILEDNFTVEEVIKEGYPEDSVRKIFRLYLRNEFKRRMGPVGPKITNVSFNGEQRLPITNQWGL
jgi:NAD+ synthase (glutamine-hydrolysing)